MITEDRATYKVERKIHPALINHLVGAAEELAADLQELADLDIPDDVADRVDEGLTAIARMLVDIGDRSSRLAGDIEQSKVAA
jgi:hypothetical protein